MLKNILREDATKILELNQALKRMVFKPLRENSNNV